MTAARPGSHGWSADDDDPGITGTFGRFRINAKAQGKKQESLVAPSPKEEENPLLFNVLKSCRGENVIFFYEFKLGVTPALSVSYNAKLMEDSGS